MTGDDAARQGQDTASGGIMAFGCSNQIGSKKGVSWLKAGWGGKGSRGSVGWGLGGQGGNEGVYLWECGALGPSALGNKKSHSVSARRLCAKQLQPAGRV